TGSVEFCVDAGFSHFFIDGGCACLGDVCGFGAGGINGDVIDGDTVNLHARNGGGGGTACDVCNRGTCDICRERARAQSTRLRIDDVVDADGLTGICADLEQGAGKGAVQQLGAVEVGLACHAADFGRQLLDLGV